MARDTGAATFTSGNGNKTINIGMSGVTWMQIDFGGTTIRHSTGYIGGGSQYSYPDNVSSLVNDKAIVVKNNAGTVILEGTWTSFTGTSVNFNITTAPATMPQMLLNFGNS